METENKLSLEKLLDRFSDITKYKLGHTPKYKDIFFCEDNGERFAICISTQTFLGSSITTFEYIYNYFDKDPEGNLVPAGMNGFVKRNPKLEQLYQQLRELYHLA